MTDSTDEVDWYDGPPDDDDDEDCVPIEEVAHREKIAYLRGKVDVLRTMGDESFIGDDMWRTHEIVSLLEGYSSTIREELKALEWE